MPATVQFGVSDAYEAAGEVPVTSCYDGALVRYSDDGRDVTVVGTADFMTNGGLLADGNAALAMNLAGTNPRVIWYAPQQREGESDAGVAPSDLIPPARAVDHHPVVSGDRAARGMAGQTARTARR